MNSLAKIIGGKVHFDRAAIFRRAWVVGGVPIRLACDAHYRRRALRDALRRAWAEARQEAAFLRERIANEARRERDRAEILARFGTAENLRQELFVEECRGSLATPHSRLTELRRALELFPA